MTWNQWNSSTNYLKPRSHSLQPVGNLLVTIISGSCREVTDGVVRQSLTGHWQVAEVTQKLQGQMVTRRFCLLHVKTLWDKIAHRKVALRSGTGGQLVGDWLKISGGTVVVTDNPRTVWSLIFMDSSHPPIANQSPAAQWLVADWLPIDVQLKKGSLDCMVVAMVAAVFYHKAVTNRLQCMCDQGLNCASKTHCSLPLK